MPPDNWIYIQEPDVRDRAIADIQQLEPRMVADPKTIWLGLEYFCREGDDLWSMDDGRFWVLRQANSNGSECSTERRARWHLVRVPKAYPAYFGGYSDSPRYAPIWTGSRTLSCRAKWYAPV